MSSSLNNVYGDTYFPSIPVLSKCNAGMNINGSCYNCSQGYIYNPNIGCIYVGGTDDNLNPYYVSQKTTSCPSGQTLQQGVNNFCVNNSAIKNNTNYSPFSFQASCPDGYTLEGTLCYDKAAMYPSVCPVGYGTNGNVCVSSSCEKGYTWVNGSCLMFPTPLKPEKDTNILLDDIMKYLNASPPKEVDKIESKIDDIKMT